MQNRRNIKHTIISTLLISLLSIIACFIVKKGDDFAGIGIVYITLFAAIGIGALLLLLRFTGIIKSQAFFLYNYLGTLNIFLAALQLILLALDIVDTGVLRILLTNLAIGAVIYYDIYFREPVSSQN